MKFLTEPNDLFMEVDKVCGSVFSANKYKDIMEENNRDALAVMLSEMNDRK